MATNSATHSATRQPPASERTSGTIVAAAYREDGWEIEVENAGGVRLAYWIGGLRSVPSIGSTVHFYRGSTDNRVCSIEIEGTRLFDTCSA